MKKATHNDNYSVSMKLFYSHRNIAAAIGPKCYVEDWTNGTAGSVVRVLCEGSGLPYAVEVDGARGRNIINIEDIDFYEPWGPENDITDGVYCGYDPFFLKDRASFDQREDSL